MSDETYVCQCADSTAIPGHPGGHHPWCPFYPKETTEAAPTQVFLNTTPFGETDILERLAALEERVEQVDEVADVAFNRSNFLGDEIDKLTERVERLEDKDNLRHLGLNDLTKRMEKLVNALYQMSLDMSLITGKEWMPDTPEPEASWYNTPAYWHGRWAKADARLKEAEELLEMARPFVSHADYNLALDLKIRDFLNNESEGGDAVGPEELGTEPDVAKAGGSTGPVGGYRDENGACTHADSPDGSPGPSTKAGECTCILLSPDTAWKAGRAYVYYPGGWRDADPDCPIHGTPGPQDRSG